MTDDRGILLDEMTWVEVRKILETDPFVLIPIGATEEHGRHLPLCVDNLAAYEVAIRAARKAKEMGIQAVMTPLIPLGFAGETMFFPGTISLEAETVTNVLLDILRSLIKHGFTKLIVVNGHGGNVTLVDVVCRRIRDETKGKIVVASTIWWHLAAAVVDQVREGSNVPEHAGELESSIVMYLRPDLVNKQEMVNVDKELPIFASENLAQFGVMIPFPSVEMITPNLGHFGNPLLASAEKGRKIIETASTQLANYMKSVNDKGYMFGFELA
jgi:creatinine amidohydrolase